MKLIKALLPLMAILIFFKLSVNAQTKIYSSTLAQIEPHITVNPTDPNNLIGVVITQDVSGLNKIGYYYSTNGGQNWTGNESTYGAVDEGDPVVVFDNDGIAYVFYQRFSENSFYMRKSTDGGVTWQPSLNSQATRVFILEPPYQLDKPWIAVSPIRNSQSKYDIYLSYTKSNTITNVQSADLLKSTNGGINFNSIYTVTPADPTLDNNGTYVETGPNGEIYFCWATMALDKISYVQSISAIRSTDGGSSFTNSVTIAASQIGEKDIQNNKFKVKSAIKADSYPRLAVDKSGHYMGNVYLVWANKGTSTNSDIKMIKGVVSGGTFTWQTSPINVDVSADEQWMPAISVSPDGVVSVLYYSSGINRLDPIYTYVKYSTDGGSTFSAAQNIGTSGGFTISSSGDVFLGDYHGSSSWFGKAHSIFCEYKTDPTYNARQIYYNYTNLPPLSAPANYQKVVVDQKDEANQSFEKFGRWNQGQFTNYTAPFTFTFPLNSSQVIRAKQDFKQGTYQKYNNWNLSSEILNHKPFTILQTTNTITSNFKTSQGGITIKNKLENVNDGDGTIYFADPWLIDYNESPYGMRNQGINALLKSRTSPFYPNYSLYYGSDIYRGVFLNQDYNIPGQPYYSVQALSSQTINNYTSYFHNWSANDNSTFQDPNSLTTGVVIKNSNTVISAIYKGHLISNSTNSFNTNSQRKVVRTSNGHLHMVYESMNAVWYTRSTSGGYGWESEIRVSPLGVNAKSASIAHSNDGLNKVYIVYQRDVMTGDNYSKIKVVEFNNLVQTWSADVYTLSSYSYDTKPVVAALNNTVCVVFKPISTSGLREKNFYYDGISIWTPHADFLVQNTTSSSTDPSISSDVQRYFLTYQNGTTTLKFLQFIRGTNDAISVDEESTISTGSPYTYNNSASISTHEGDPIISWNGYSTGIPTAVVKRRVGGVWSNFSSFASGAVRYTNNNSVDAYTDGSIIGWCNIYNQYQYVRLFVGSYSGIQNLSITNGNGQIQLSNGYDFHGIKAVVTQQPTSNIYPVTPLTYDFLNMQKASSDDNMNYGRMAIVQLANQNDGKGKKNFVYYLGGVKVDGENIEFTEYVDTLKIKGIDMLNEVMSTEHFHLTPKSEVVLSNSYYAFDNDEYKEWKENDAAFSIELVNLNGKVVEGEFNNSKFELSIITDDRLSFKLDCSNIEEGTYYLRVKCRVNGEAEYFVNNIMDEDLPSLNKGSYEEIKIDENGIPNNYSLGVNYPNPFNPTTTITFSIPNSQFVTLKVYDVLGKEVAVLVDGVQNSGKHEVTFSASELASGIYFYTLKAGEFSQTNKMILLK